MSLWHRHPGVRSGNALTRGERAADAMRNGMGSWPFVLLFLVFLLSWAALNTIVLAGGYDPYPYILLNLFLSMLAAIQGAILLIAAKRQDQISSELAHHDDELLTQNTALTNEIHRLTAELHAKTFGDTT